MKDLFLPASNPKAPLLVFFHGYGANAQNLFSCGHALQEALPGLAIWIPNGNKPFEKAPDGYGRQWFSLEHFSLTKILSQPGLPPVLHSAIKQSGLQVQTRLQHIRGAQQPVIFAGFSQGAALACHMGLFQMQSLGTLSFSGFFKETTPPQFKPPLWIYHGMCDDVVPFSAMEYLLAYGRNHHLSVTLCTDPTATHTISDTSLKSAANFLKGLTP